MDKLLAGRRILVVEDEMLILMMIETILEDLGCGSITTVIRFTRKWLYRLDADQLCLAPDIAIIAILTAAASCPGGTARHPDSGEAIEFRF
jgi:CheY-like chemotaxis protein